MLTVTQAGTYRFVFIGGDACTGGEATATVTANPIITPPASTISPNPIVLTACTPAAGATLQWTLNGANIPGATGTSYTATQSGSYGVVITTGTLSVSSGLVFLSIGSASCTLSAAASGGPLPCGGGTLSLTAVPTGGTAPYTYQWKQGSTSVGSNAATFAASVVGSYTVEITDSKGCKATSAPLTVSAAANCLTASITLPASTATAPIVLTANTGTGYTYQWQRNSAAIPGATGASYTATQSGSYTVVVTAVGQSVTSAPVVLTINLPTGLEPGPAVLSLRVYPNPAAEACEVEYAAPTAQPLRLSLLNSEGRELERWHLSATPQAQRLRVRLPAAGGMYLLRAEHPSGQITTKVLKINP